MKTKPENRSIQDQKTLKNFLTTVKFDTIRYMPPQFDFNGGPDKIFVDSTNTAFGKGTLVTHFRSGEQHHVFLFEIAHAKQYARVLLQNIEAYEKQYGQVDGRLPTEPMPTPFQYPKNNEGGPDEKK